MPRQREWYQRVPEALKLLRALPCPVVDRSTLESLLGLKRRQAIRMMVHFGGYQSGRAYLVDRQDLIQQLEIIRQGEDYSHDKRRRQRVAEMATKLAAEWGARQTIISPPRQPVKGYADLPETITLEAERLEIRYRSQEDLLTQLLALVQAISRDLS